MGDDGAEGLADHRSWHVVLGKPAGPEIDLIDRGEGGLQPRQRAGIVSQLFEARIGRQVECFAGLVQRAKPEVVAALDVDGG